MDFTRNLNDNGFDEYVKVLQHSSRLHFLIEGNDKLVTKLDACGSLTMECSIIIHLLFAPL